MTIRMLRVLAAVMTIAILAVAACTTGSPQPLTQPGLAMDCPSKPQPAWVMRLSASGSTVWRSPLRGWAKPTAASPTTTNNQDSGLVSLLTTDGVVVAADGDAVTGFQLSDGHPLWRWAGTGWVSGLWQWHGLVIALDGGQQAQLTGLRVATGAVAWTRSFLAQAAEFQSAQTADGGMAITAGRGGLEVISLADGTVRWQRHVAGYVTSLVGTEGVLAAEFRTSNTGPADVAVYDDRSGASRGTYSGLSLSPPALSDGSLVVGLPSQTPSAAVFDPGTGKLNWPFTIPTDGPASVLPDPHAPGGPGAVIASSASGQVWLLSLTDGALRRSGSLPSATKAAVMSGQDMIALLVPGSGDGSSGTPGSAVRSMTSLDVATGRTLWTRPIESAVTGPIVESGTELVISGSPAFSDEKTPGVLLAYHATTGQPAWRATLPAALKGNPVPAGGGVVAQAGFDTSEVCTAN